MSPVVKIPTDSFVRKTGQLWKLVLAGLVLPFPTALFGWWSIRQIRPDQPASEALAHIGILVVAAAVILALLMSVRCPRCHVRLVAKVIRVEFAPRLSKSTDLVHCFSTTKTHLKKALPFRPAHLMSAPAVSSTAK
jgi:hypothetical protein